MAADLSRVRFDPQRDHSGVVLQQGRLLLDADWNELVAIIDRRLRANAADLGSTGPAPGIAGVAVVPRTTPNGFRVEATAGAITIGQGRMYVDGLLAENHGTGDATFDRLLAETRYSKDMPYDEQPYWPTATALPGQGTHLVYLDVWEREVTHIESPDLVEQAVGVDTTARAQTVWQVRVLDADASAVTCTTPDADVPGWLDVIAPSAGRLTTGTVPVDEADDPCELPATGGYRGLENQTYRVEIHEGGAPGTATFKWSRDQASVASGVVEVVSSTRLRPASLGRDDVLRFRTGHWVEILDDHRELDQRPGAIRRIEVHEEDGTVSFAPALPVDLQMTTAQAAARHLRLRRWDQHGRVLTTTGAVVVDLDVPAADGVIPVPASGAAVVLERGVTVQLQAPAGRFRAGDHWIFAARTNDASVETLLDAPPLGTHHHFARLAIVTFPGDESDCRVMWPPVTTGGGGDCGDCTVCVTPTSHASGAMTIQDAVDQATPTGGTVCLAPGTYRLDEGGVRIIDARSLTLRGQGPRTLLLARGNAIEVRNSAFVTLESLAVVSAAGQAAVELHATTAVTVQRLTVLVAGETEARRAAIELSSLALLTRLRENVVLAPVGIAGGDGDKAALLTAGLEITENLLVCRSLGVTLDGRVAHVLGNSVRGNTVLRSADAAVRALGEVGPRASFDVSANTLLIEGSGVEVGTSGFGVRDNNITGLPRSLERRGDGVAVLGGTFGRGRGPTAVTGNQVRDVGGVGIVVRSPVGDLDVAHNVVERAGAGIVLEERGRAVVVSVTSNVVRDVGSRESDEAEGVAGIQVVGAARANVDGNTVVGVGTARESGPNSAGVRVLASTESRIAGNSVDRVGFPDTPVPAVGVQVGGFFARVVVEGNFARRLPDDVDEIPPSPWTGLEIGHRPDQEGHGATHMGGYVAVPGPVTYLIGPKAAHAARTFDVSAIVDANTVSGGGEAPAVLVSVPGDVIVSSNQCRQPREAELPALELYAESATVNANRARGGRPSMSLEVDPARVAVVANLTSDGIRVAGSPLSGPWIALNPDGI